MTRSGSTTSKALRAVGDVDASSSRLRHDPNTTRWSFGAHVRHGAIDDYSRARLPSHRQAKSETFGYIEVCYNCHRIHTSLGGFSPANFELNND